MALVACGTRTPMPMPSSQKMQPLRTEKCRPSRRHFGFQMLSIPAMLTLSERAFSLGLPEEEGTEGKVDTDMWDEYRGKGFVLKIPPGFEDTSEPNDLEPGESSMYGDKAKPKVYAACFASSDREEFVSVVIRRSSQLKPTFFSAKSIEDLGSVQDVSKLFLPIGARVTASSSMSADSRVYYLCEYRVAEKHVFVSAAAANGQVFIAAATAPESRWETNGDLLRSSAKSFVVL